LVKWTLLGLLLLPVAELLALTLAAGLMGWWVAMALVVATSVGGVILLRRCGPGDLDRLRAAVAREGVGAIRLQSPGAAPLLAGILLVFPGFITDLAAAALFIPGFRSWLARRLAQAARKRPRARRDRLVIDLAPSEWQQIEKLEPPKPRSPRRSRPKQR
jgi:UPF0716 protein FxsA